MKQRVLTLCLSISLPIFIASCQAGGTNRETSDSSAGANTNVAKSNNNKANVDDIRAVLAAHDKALSEKSLDGVMATFSNDPNTVVLGTGAEEHWMGQQEIRSAYTEIFKDYDPGTLETDCSPLKTGGIDEAGTMAWLATICNCKDSMQGKTREYKLNVTATVVKQDGNWRFISLHMSNAFTPPVSK